MSTPHTQDPSPRAPAGDPLAGNRLVSRLATLRAAGRRGLAPYLTAGDGGPATTLAALRAIDALGCPCVELGVPFNAPLADGPVLQAAAGRALAAGTRFETVLEIIAALRAGDGSHPPSALPVVVMTYANPLLRRGIGPAVAALAEAGADGLLVVDLPVEEGAGLRAAAVAAGLCPIPFAAPGTDDRRLAAAVAAGRGFLYAIGRFGVTGGATAVDEPLHAFLARVRAAAGPLPVAVGFGLRSAGQVAAATRHADLAIVGSALVEHLHREAEGDAGSAARAFLAPLQAALGA